jgi:hypothetical protein
MPEKLPAAPVEVVTWINARPNESRLREMARTTLRLPVKELDEPDFQSYIPVQDVGTLGETNPKLASILHKQIALRRASANHTVIPVVDENGNIKVNWQIATKPLNVTLTPTGVVERTSD